MWKEIKGSSNYEVSDCGEVRNKITGKILKGRLSHSGYLQVSLKIDELNIFRNKYIHRLVAETFLQEDDTTGKNVNHIDGNKINNTLENLEWATFSENIQHAHDNGLFKKTSNRRVGMFDKDNNMIKEFNSVAEAYRSLGKPSRTNIDSALCGKQKTAYGYFWKYLD